VYSCTNPISKKDSDKLPVVDSNMVIENKIQKNHIEKNTNLDSVKKGIQLIREKLNPTDTTKYKFQLEDVGTEGNEGFAYYINDSLKKVECDIYTSMWRYHIQYYIINNRIDVIERTYNITYNKSKKVKEITYTIDLKGKLIGDADKERIDIFQEFKKAVPFELK
jgi:hypothetical protein